MGSSKTITCTNGTLVSSINLNCGSISLGNPKSTLNCDLNHANLDLDYIPPDSTTRAPIRRPTKASTIPAPVTENTDYDDFQTDAHKINRIDLLPAHNENELMPQVKKAMENVFPHDLLVKPATHLTPPKSYLPPSETSASRDLKEVLNGVFPMNLLAISKGTESSTIASFDVRFSSGDQETTTTKVVQPQVNAQANRNVNDIGFKTQLAEIDTRFGGAQQRPIQTQQENLRDRHIFTD